jgi:hypothetical protein
MSRCLIVAWSVFCSVGAARADAKPEKPWFVAFRAGYQRNVFQEDRRPDDALSGTRVEPAGGVRYRQLELSGFYAYTSTKEKGSYSDSRSWAGARLVLYPTPWLFAGAGLVHNWRHLGDPPVERNTFEVVVGAVLLRSQNPYGGRIDVQLTYGRFEQFAESRTSMDIFPPVFLSHYSVVFGARL